MSRVQTEQMNSTDSRVKRCCSLLVLKCTDELVNIPTSDSLYGRMAPHLEGHVDQETLTEASFGGRVVFKNNLRVLFFSVCFVI